jgi:hypothetical protein
LLVDPTKPFFLIALLRFVDFLVKMCLLNAFWKVISPVPVTLKRFFALELVFTFGIIIILSITPYWRYYSGNTLIGPCGKWMAKVRQIRNIAKKKGPKISGPSKNYIDYQCFNRCLLEILSSWLLFTTCFRLENGKHSLSFQLWHTL